jgi:uncharacterized protein YecT (DUF1311 family)
MISRLTTSTVDRLPTIRTSLLTVLGGVLCLTCNGLVLHSVQAIETHIGNACANPQTQAAINACAAEQYREVDAQLNTVYRALMDRLSNERKPQLKAVQLAWIKFRESHCKFVADPYAGGSLQPTVYSGCMTETAQARSHQLRQALKDLADQ